MLLTLEDEPEHERACPRCGSLDVRLSRRSGVRAHFLAMFLLHPYRCRSCRKRFFATAGKDKITDMEDSQMETSFSAVERERSDSRAAEQFARLLRTEHWLKSYLTDLLGAHQANGLDFQTAELLLKQEKEAFEHDMVVAQRMYQLYPHMFRRDGEASGAAMSSTGPRTAVGM